MTTRLQSGKRSFVQSPKGAFAATSPPVTTVQFFLNQNSDTGRLPGSDFIYQAGASSPSAQITECPSTVHTATWRRRIQTPTVLPFVNEPYDKRFITDDATSAPWPVDSAGDPWRVQSLDFWTWAGITSWDTTGTPVGDGTAPACLVRASGSATASGNFFEVIDRVGDPNWFSITNYYLAGSGVTATTAIFALTLFPNAP